MDPNPKNFPILSYVMARLPSSISSLRTPRAGAGAAHDIEQPPFSTPTSAASSSTPFHDPLIDTMPHLKDPKIVSAMAEAVSEISQTRSILQALGDRPDHEAIDIAKSKLSEIESSLASQLDEVSLSSHPAPGVDKEREKLERERTMYKAVVQLDEMHDAYEKLLRSAEEKLVKVYDSAVREKVSGNGGDGDGDDGGDDSGEVSEEVSEEIVAILKDDCVERVDLSGRKLRILPEAFGKLRHLIVLNMSSNQLQSIPDSIAGLENLEEMNLSSNSLQSLPDSIGLLRKLKFLNVSGNKLTALPDSICFCSSLVELDASFNNLGYLPTNIGLEMVNLRKLSVPYNKIRSLPTSVGEMRSLQHLDVHFNELHGLPLTIGKVTTLVTINLSGNFSDMKELPETFCELINLEELDLSNNQIHALPDLFGMLEKLRKLNLDQNPIVIPPLEVVKSGAEAVKNYMNKRWDDLLLEEEERKRQQMLAAQETGWLKRSVSKLNDAVYKASEYLGSPRTPRDPILDQQL